MTFSERAVEAAARAAFPYFDEMSKVAQDEVLAEARQMLTAALAVDGLALVPKEPTHAMIDAALSNGQANGKPWSVNFIPTLRAIYVAMLTAASDGEVG